MSSRTAPRWLTKLRNHTVLIAFFSAALTISLIQLATWIPINGPHFYGTCRDHIGESFPCSVLQWVAQIFVSPLLWPVLLIMALVYFVLILVSAHIVAHVSKVSFPAAEDGSRTIRSLVALFAGTAVAIGAIAFYLSKG